MKKALLYLLLLVSAAGFSQIKFEPGYFIDNNGRKTECLIKNIAWKNSPIEIEYQFQEDGEVKTAGINDISEFNVGAYKFKRFKLKIERSSNITSKMDEKRDLQWNDETLFLKVLVEGKATLYQYEESNLIKYFYSSGDHSTAEQLVYKEYIIDGRINEINQYRQQLYNLMKDGIPSMSRFEKINYKKDPLVDLFVEYNTTQGQGTTDLSKNQNRSTINLKFTPGIGFSSLELSNPSFPKAGTKFDSEVNFRIGLEVEYVMPFNNNKWSLFIDPNYQTYKASASNGVYDMNVEYSFLELPIGVRHYFYLNNTSKLFLNASYTFDLNLKDSKILRNNSQIPSNSQEPLTISKTTHFAVGAGFSYNRFSIEARYNLPHGLLKEYASWLADYSTTNIILGYRFL